MDVHAAGERGAAATSPPSSSLTVLVPTTKPWPHAAGVVDRLVDQVAAVGGEVLVVAGDPRGIPADPDPRVRWLAVPGGDVFALRSAGMAAARGDAIALLEDHTFAPPGWAAAVVGALDEHPEADGVVGVVSNGAPSLLDRASFLLTWAPLLAPMAEVPPDRSPPPGALTLRRRALPDGAPAAGDVEYVVACRLRDEGRLVADDRIRLTHIQHLGLRAFVLQYHAGRGFTGGLCRLPGTSRRHLARQALRMPVLLVRQTDRGVRRADAWPRSLRELAVVGAYATCNAAGQVVGVLTGSPGRAFDHLE